MSNNIVVVTGLNGFIATHVAVHFLTHGWVVRGTVRSDARVNDLKAHSTWKPWFDKGVLEVYVVPDLETFDFSSVLEGAAAVAHLAAPVDFTLKTWEAFRDPTVKGTENILEHAAKVPSIKAVSVMSSMAAACDVTLFPPAAHKGRVYSETTFSPVGDLDLAAFDPANPLAPLYWYSGAKLALEKAAEETKTRVGATYALSIVCPPMVYGPAIHLSTPEDVKKDFTQSTKEMLAMIAGDSAEIPFSFSTSYVDARDLAQAFRLLVTEAKDGRWIISSGDYDWQKVSVILRKARPELAKFVPIGKPEEPSVLDQGSWELDTTKSKEQLGLIYTAPEVTWIDILDYWVTLGVLKP